MSKVKDKLLSAIGDINLSDVAESTLVDILVAKIKALESEVSNLHGANAHERLILDSQRDNLHRDMKELRRNPLFGAHGMYYFIDSNGVKFDVHAIGGKIDSAAFYKKSIRCLMKQVTAQEFFDTK